MHVVWIIILRYFLFLNFELSPLFRHFDNESEWILCYLSAQLLRFYANSFDTLQVSLSWSEDMHVVWIYP